MKPDLRIRILSGLVLAPLSVALIVGGGFYFMAFVGVGLLAATYECAKLSEGFKHKYMTFLAGMTYILLTFMSYIYLRFAYDQGAWLTLGIILCVWASDIGAYFTGKKIGGAKLAPKISPNKTWAGFGGAVFFCGLMMMILVGCGPWLKDYLDTDLGIKARDVWQVFFVGGFLGAVGQAGDLLISFVKRRVGMKDSGALIPGHGGILDRIDALMLVSLVSALIVLAWL